MTARRFGIRWTVGRRIAALGVLFVAALAAAGGVGYRQAGQSGRQADEAFTVAGALSTAIDAQHAASVVLADAYRLTTAVTRTQRSETIAQLDEHAGELRDHLATLQALHFTGEVQGRLATLEPTIEAVLAVVPDLDRTVGAPTADLLARTQRAWDTFDGASDEAKNALQDQSTRHNAAARTSSQRARRLILLVALPTIPLVGGAMLLITRAVAGPIGQTRSVLRDVADGDFTRRMTHDVPDDLGEMAAAVNATVQRVGAAIGAIRREADTLAAAAQRLDTVSEQVATGAQRMTAEAGTVAGNANDVSGDVQTVAASSEQMQAAISEISRNAADAARIVDEAVGVAQSANEIMSKLGTSSAEIEEVAKVITSIADQTNLLALNATIEAARAGDAGRGFAVVASEVKELAQETGKATESIGRRIETIQADSANAVSALNRIAETINRIQEIQQTIASAVEQQSAFTHEISTSVNRVAGRAGDIATRITTVRAASQEATTAADQTRQAASDLASTATNLQTIVGRFQIPAGSAS